MMQRRQLGRVGRHLAAWAAPFLQIWRYTSASRSWQSAPPRTQMSAPERAAYTRAAATHGAGIPAASELGKASCLSHTHLDRNHTVAREGGGGRSLAHRDQAGADAFPDAAAIARVGRQGLEDDQLQPIWQGLQRHRLQAGQATGAALWGAVHLNCASSPRSRWVPGSAAHLPNA